MKTRCILILAGIMALINIGCNDSDSMVMINKGQQGSASGGKTPGSDKPDPDSSKPGTDSSKPDAEESDKDTDKDDNKEEDGKPGSSQDAIGDQSSEMDGVECFETDGPDDIICVGNKAAECKGGQYYIKDICTELCTEGIGCTSCEPKARRCDGNDVYACNEAGTGESKIETCKLEGCSNGYCGEAGCPIETQYVYLVSSTYDLVKFNPGAKDKDYFEILHRLNCSATSTPFSMAVDREANAWVLYQDSTLYKVNIQTNACEKIVNFRNNGSGLTTFGMGFSLDKVGGDTDTLFIGDMSSSGHFGRIDVSTMSYTQLASFPKNEQSPELTGTGLAKVYGFFPGAASQSIVEIDKETGNVVTSYAVPGVGGSVSAWAFAHWGGYFFSFESIGNTNNVYRYDITSNQFELFTTSPYRIVGAGVSTCAPTEVN